MKTKRKETLKSRMDTSTYHTLIRITVFSIAMMVLVLTVVVVKADMDAKEEKARQTKSNAKIIKQLDPFTDPTIKAMKKASRSVVPTKVADLPKEVYLPLEETETPLEATSDVVWAEETEWQETVSETDMETTAIPNVDESAMTSTPEELRTMGVVFADTWRYTWYSENVLPGGGLSIPGRWSDGNFVRDENGYICVASSDLPYGTEMDTPWGAAKVYDTGCDSGTIDMYTSW